VHIHTTASDGTASPRQILEWVRDRTDLAVIAITDHNTVEGALEAAALAEAGDYPFDVVVGQEVESCEGHVLGLWAPEPVRPDMTAAETVGAIHAQGGLAVAAHPFAPRWWHRHGLRRGSVLTYNSVPFDAFETANSTPLLGLANRYARLYWLANRERLARTGGSDAHILAAIGSSRTLFPGESAEDLRRAIEERTTVVKGPDMSATRGLRYARRAPEIKRRGRDYKERQREAEDEG